MLTYKESATTLKLKIQLLSRVGLGSPSPKVGGKNIYTYIYKNISIHICTYIPIHMMNYKEERVLTGWDWNVENYMYICANIPTYATYFKRKSKRKGVEFFFFKLGQNREKVMEGWKWEAKLEKGESMISVHGYHRACLPWWPYHGSIHTEKTKMCVWLQY